jgi:hypothetical protein
MLVGIDESGIEVGIIVVTAGWMSIVLLVDNV